jgi:Ca2+-binding RTX toxin-like protein
VAAAEVNLPSLNPQTQRQLIPEIRCGNQVATIVGGPAADSIQGTVGNDVIASLGGKDKVKGGKGDDTICLGDAADTGRGGPGRDLIIGGTGKDTCVGGPARDRARQCEIERSIP